MPHTISVLEERHMISIMLFLAENDGCNKTCIYDAVSRNPRMPEKLNALEESGLLVQASRDDSRSTTVSLTEKGRIVSDHLRGIRDEIET